MNRSKPALAFWLTTDMIFTVFSGINMFNAIATGGPGSKVIWIALVGVWLYSTYCDLHRWTGPKVRPLLDLLERRAIRRQEDNDSES